MGERTNNGKDVCIVTWYGKANYGTSIQALALAKVLEARGYHVSFLKRFMVKPFLIRHPVLLYARVMKKIGSRKRNAFFTPVPYRLSEERQQRIREFNRENYRELSITTTSEWRRIIGRKTIFAAGGDILWNPARGYPAEPFLDFAYYAGLPRFSYGSSVGSRELPKKYHRAYRRYLSSMKEIGVREQAVADMLEPIVHRKVNRVADASLLLTEREWNEYADRAQVSVPVQPGGFVLCYFVMNDPRYWEYAAKVREAAGLQMIVLPMHELDEQQPYDVIRDGTLCEFIRLIRDAAFICTDSFHACAISLIYRKEFYLLRRSRKAEDDKYDDFLKRYRLTDRIVRDEQVFERKPDTDYSHAGQQLAEDVLNSLAYLDKVLEECAE